MERVRIREKWGWSKISKVAEGRVTGTNTTQTPVFFENLKVDMTIVRDYLM